MKEGEEGEANRMLISLTRDYNGESQPYKQEGDEEHSNTVWGITRNRIAPPQSSILCPC